MLPHAEESDTTEVFGTLYRTSPVFNNTSPSSSTSSSFTLYRPTDNYDEFIQ